MELVDYMKWTQYEENLKHFLKVVDKLRKEVKMLKNYEYDRLCAELEQGLLNKQKELFGLINQWYTLEDDKFKQMDLKAILKKQSDDIDNMWNALCFLRNKENYFDVN